MPYIEWSDEFSVNVTKFDEEHKQLVDLINELHQGLRSGFKITEMRYILDGLLKYVTEHFSHEEEAMQKYNYPELTEHKKSHDALVSKVTDFKDRLDSGEGSFTIELLGFLKEWIVNHIQGTDKKYSEFFADKSV